MGYQYKTATVFGGTGFVGRQVVRELAARGIVVKIATRIPESAYFLKPCGTVGQIVPWHCNYNDQDAVDAAVAGSDIVVNCVGILFEKGKSSFQKAHVDIPSFIAKACKAHDVKRFVHVSSLSAGRCKSQYANSKYEGEKAIQAVFPAAVILRPSVIFGEDDNFFNMFAGLMHILPAFPLIGGGHTKLQPVFVGDVADAVMAGIDGPAMESGEDPQGLIFELGGPDVITFKDVYTLIFKYTGKRRALVPLPFSVARVQSFFMNLMPTPLLTPDQVESLKTDNVVADNARGLQDLGITPTAMSLVLPTYLERHRRGGRFGQDSSS